MGSKSEGDAHAQFLWAFNVNTSEDLGSNINEYGRGYALGLSNAHDGGMIFFGKKDNGRLKIFKADVNGYLNEL